jgi:predicted alpha-1,6-mannanase (GH76 family)
VTVALIIGVALASVATMSAVASAQSCAIVADGQCAVDLGEELNHDGTATVTNSDQGNFDGLGWSYDADLLPPAGPVTWDGVTYHAPDAAGTAPNFVEARGQALPLPPDAYGSLRLVAASHNGPVTTNLTVQYVDGSSAEVPVTVGDWAGSAPTGSTVALEMAHRIRAGQGIDGPSVRLFGHFIALDSTKAIQALALPDDPRIEIYAVTLRAPTPPVEVCNIYCDGRDPALAAGDRIGGTASVGGRDVVLHFSDSDNMVWASITDGEAGDEVWLDRSFDGARTWEPDGSRLGHTTVPSGQQGWRTLMYNVDNPDARQIGAVRACAKPGDEPEGACTPWARSTVNATTRVDAAATALMQFYNQRRGLWDTTGWWNSANALTALIDYSQRTGSRTYRYAIATTFNRNEDTNFINEYIDDTGWWGLAWVRAYDLTGDDRYLDMARVTADYMNTYWDDHCGGGVWWRTDMTYKNAVTNELFIKLSAALHNRIPGDTIYLARAQQGWSWFKASGMINSESLINDGLNAECQNNGQTTWTYNQGIILGGLVELYRATGDADLLTEARRIADAATSSTFLNPEGILREPCEPGCGTDAPSFKGIFVRNLSELDRALPGRPYRAYLTRQAASAYANNRNSLDQYGLSWAGPFDSADAARQHVALDLLTATVERVGAPDLRVSGRPKVHRVGSARRQVRYAFRARNVGDATTGEINLCVRGPQRRVAIRGKRCAASQVPPGQTRTRPVLVRIKRAARGEVTPIRLIARGLNVATKRTMVRLQVRP